MCKMIKANNILLTSYVSSNREKINLFFQYTLKIASTTRPPS